jgi:hypothetical protein
MDIPIPLDPGAPDEFPSDAAGWAAEFRRQVQIVERATREFGVRWDEPEGRFVASLLGMMQRLARLSAATKASIEATVKQADATIVAELEAVRELRRSVEAIKGQTEAVRVLATVEREHAIQRMALIEQRTRRSPATITRFSPSSRTIGGWIRPWARMLAVSWASCSGMALVRRGLFGLDFSLRGLTVLSSTACRS